ncbi:ATP-dependent RNA helicase DDX42 isoform X2 [Hydra vulgaris]|uniref:RNA helicase n=1 Tax=Hydra vulgaris TaxID=6087 RepID=A0ABM4CSS1_HYDVU
MHTNDRYKNTAFSGFTLKKENLASSALPFQKYVSASQTILPKFHTDENEKRYLQESGAGVTEEDLYDPLNPTDVDETLLQPKMKKKRVKTRWDVDDEILPTRPIGDPVTKKNKNADCAYQQSGSSPHNEKANEYSDEDELDKFMAGVEETLEKEEEDMKNKISTKKSKKDARLDVENEDDQESYFKARKDIPLIPYPEDEDEIEYDSDGNPLPPERSKIIVPLPQVDHLEIDYPPFESNFYEDHPDIKALTEPAVKNLREKLGLKVMGADPARPAISFGHFGFDDHLMGVIRSSNYSKPTPIQSQAVPVALSGRDIIGIARTGSGKTAAFVWPMLVHIMAQPVLKEGDGPIALICAPTRELCQQINSECKRFGKCYNLRSVACYGGGSKWEQTKGLQQGAEIVVCTPGRLIDLIKAKATNLLRVTYLVFDEADRMFDMGFEPQVRSIANNVRPDRQCLLFSATMKKKVEWLCRDILSDPIRIVVGELGEANEDIVQAVEVMKSPQQKWNWLLSHIVEFTSGGSVLIFVTKKSNSEEVAANLKEQGYELGLIHGDFDQFERNNVLKQFKQKLFLILVATDVAARGLDIPSIKTVINYDVARDITTHTHRIGRTGRAGEKGIAYTLITPQDTHFAADLVRNLEGANQRVPDELLDLALKNPWFRKTRAKRGRKAANKEFTPRDRPGLGLPEGKGGGNDEGNLADEEELTVGNSGGKRPSRSLLTSYAMSSTAFGSNRLNNLKSAFATGYNRFAKASDSGNSTMDVGTKSGSGAAREHFDPADQPKAMQKWDR